MQDKTDFIGTPRVGMSSTSVDTSKAVENELQELIKQDTILYEKHFKNKSVKEQADEINKKISKEKSEIFFEQKNGTDEEDLKNEIEAFLQQDQEKTMNDIQKTELGIPIEKEAISDEQCLKSSNVTSQRLEENSSRSEESVSISMKNKASFTMADNSGGSLDIESQALEDTHLYYTSEPNLKSGSDFMSSVEAKETNHEQILVSFEHISKEDNTPSQSTQMPDIIVEKRNFNYDSNTSAMENSGISTEDSSEDGIVPQTTQVPECPDEQNSNSGNNSEVSESENAGTSFEDDPKDGIVSQVLESPDDQSSNSGNNTEVSESEDTETSFEDEPEEDIESQTTQVPEGTDEQNSSSGNNSKVSKLENAGTSFKSYLKDCNISKSLQVSIERVDEKNSTSETNCNEVKNTERSTEDTSAEEISNKKYPPKEGRRTSEKVTETISRCLNSEEYIKKLNEIDTIVKQLTAIEFISPQLSTEDVEALEDLYGQQVPLEADVDWEKYSEVSESNATKRKSKESLEFADELQATSKKYKFSKDQDSWPLSGEKLCCLEEQFRLASELSKEDNEGQSQKDKEYKFPVTTESGEGEGKYKLCKHQIEKIDALVISAMSMENYISQLKDEIDNNEMSTDDLISNESSNRNQTLSDSQSKVPKSQSSSARTRTFSQKNVTLQQEPFHDKEISQPKEQFAEVEMNSNGYGCFGFGKAFNSIKNLILFVSFTGTLTIAITIAKLFGVTFPIPNSQRKNVRNDSECSLQKFPDLNLDEA